jgi:hypothetical protein
MDKEKFSKTFEEEPIKESEITCDCCGDVGLAAWEVITDEHEVLFVCHKHHTRLLEKNIVTDERRIGEDTWEEVEDLRIFLNKIDMEKYGKGRK